MKQYPQKKQASQKQASQKQASQDQTSQQTTSLERDTANRAGKSSAKHSAPERPGLAVNSAINLIASAEAIRPGCLWVVATPIGNLEDITARALRCLNEADLIYCEDTRTSATLLRHYGISTSTRSLHEHNEAQRIAEIQAQLQNGKNVALISDAGTPLISDPGFVLVAALRQAGLPVFAIPGASALTAALSVSGLACQRFIFEGFLPAASKARRDQLQLVAGEQRTLVFYEASHRIVESIGDMASIFGADRPAAVVKELSKHFERCIGGNLAQISAQFAASPELSKGEFVVIVSGAAAKEPGLESARQLLITLQTELAPAQAARIAAKLTGLSKRALYSLMNSVEDVEA